MLGMITGMMGMATSALPGIGQLVGAVAGAVADKIKGDGSDESDECKNHQHEKVAAQVHQQTTTSFTYNH
ncbi:hypothetical protein SAMN04490207_5329 [Pseudomonas gessardii]|nr:hypothetical protein BLL38_12885 [Pseudomonas gessardii]SDR34224.1 hypothetical protein SAMN04490207_5329 [Pseudomonas gessardii]